jgi:hypothetical protein
MKSIFRGRDLWLRIGWLLLAYLIILGSRDLYLRGSGTGNGEFLGAFSIEWGIGLIGYGLIALVGILICGFGIIRLDRILAWIKALEDWSHRLRLVAWLIVICSFLSPFLLLLGPWGWRFDLPHFRVMLLVCSSIIAGIFLPQKSTNWIERSALMILLSAALLLLTEKFLLITNYPFATSWSEGNRLWDYSLYFARDLYIFEEPFTYPTYLTPGRHGLWGLPFLFLSRPSIVVMRTWDTFLWTFPYIFLGLAVFSFRHTSLARNWRWIMTLWTFLFLSQGPIYAPLVLSGVILAVGYHRKRLWQSILVTAVACFYAGISRWTWMVAPAAWAVLWTLFESNANEKLWNRMKRPIALGIAGLTGAALSFVVMNFAFPRPDPIYSTSLSQPLLWYRLWSSATNPTGVVNGLLYAIGPFLIWMIVMIIRRRKDWDLLKIFVASAVLVGFLGIGLVASVKIGGGSNIHNLDMLLVTLIFLAPQIGISKESFTRYTGYIWALLAVILLLPVWNLTQGAPSTDIPENSDPEQALAEIQDAVQEASQEGEVLFIDQRQLFTFGEITDVPLVMDYELKDMMNQAMGHNEAYFAKFREDIENHRFRLIISDGLFIVFQGPKIAFGEENDAWVEEVTIPILNAYEPVMEFNDHHIWLLAPKAESEK